MNEKELELIHRLVDDVEYLLDYARRVAQRQVVKEDIEGLKEIRRDLKEAKEVFNCI